MRTLKFIRRSFLYYSLTTLILFSVSIAIAQDTPLKLVNTEWLAANLSMANLRIVDVRDNVTAYWQEHIPEAIYLSPDAMRWPDHGFPVKLIPPKNLARLMGKMGISNKTTVVIYSEKGDYKAPYLQWALDCIGHKKSMILDGGFSKWKNENRPVNQDYPKITPVTYKIKLNKDVRAKLAEVESVVAKGGAIIIDVRPVELYIGEKGNWKRKGHIKGAINHFWGLDLNDNGTWKSKDELKKIYEEIGATPDKTIIVSCGQGQMSAHSYFTLKHILDYPKVKNYDGSFSEWSNIDDLPVNTGSNP
jgi:thiosulfate/3-mercaptopyruvate sulfurtransferase